MSLIKNLVKEPERKDSKSDNDSDGEKKPKPMIKSAIDLQRLKLEKLMKNPVSIEKCYELSSLKFNCRFRLNTNKR